jgi:hypothetical protein
MSQSGNDGMGGSCSIYYNSIFSTPVHRKPRGHTQLSSRRGLCVKMTTHHVVLRSVKRGSIHPLRWDSYEQRQLSITFFINWLLLLQRPFPLRVSDFVFHFCCLCAHSVNVTILILLYIVCHYMFRLDWPSSSVQVAALKGSVVLLFSCNCLCLFLC